MRNDTRTGVLFCPLNSTRATTLEEAAAYGWKVLFDNGCYYDDAAQANMIYVYDGDHMVTVKDRHAKTGKIVPISDVYVPGDVAWRNQDEEIRRRFTAIRNGRPYSLDIMGQPVRKLPSLDSWTDWLARKIASKLASRRAPFLPYPA